MVRFWFIEFAWMLRNWQIFLPLVYLYDTVCFGTLGKRYLADRESMTAVLARFQASRVWGQSATDITNGVQ